MRQRYEQPADTANELYGLVRLCDKFGGSIVHHPSGENGADGLWHSRPNGPDILVEYKHRNAADRKFAITGGLMLSKQKAERLKHHVLMIGWSDGEYWITQIRNGYTESVSGRTNAARDEYDIEPCVFIPDSDFVKWKP